MKTAILPDTPITPELYKRWFGDKLSSDGRDLAWRMCKARAINELRTIIPQLTPPRVMPPSALVHIAMILDAWEEYKE